MPNVKMVKIDQRSLTACLDFGLRTYGTLTVLRDVQGTRNWANMDNLVRPRLIFPEYH